MPASGDGSDEGETARRMARTRAQARRIRRLEQRTRYTRNSEAEEYAATRRAGSYCEAGHNDPQNRGKRQTRRAEWQYRREKQIRAAKYRATGRLNVGEGQN